MTQIVIVAGDSWSINNFYDVRNVEFYPPPQSLANQLQTRLGRGAIVTSWATQGTNLTTQTERLLQGTEHALGQYAITVVMGWTDWARELNGNVHTFRFQHPDYHPDYEQSRRVAHGIQQQCVDSLSHLRMLHWGGHSHVPQLEFPTNHTVIEPDYCASLGHPASTTGTLTYYKPTLELFPDTDPGLAKRVDKQNQTMIEYRHSHPREYPDGGHLAWDRYTKLVNTICKHCTES
jgi:hypothetical protein